jgi:hypothetical protein
MIALLFATGVLVLTVGSAFERYLEDGMTAKLSETQRELLDAMESGVVVRFMPYMGRFNENEYYYRTDNLKRCTAAARALEDKGLVEEFDKSFRGHSLRIKSVQEAK